ncbi:hypothetical protein GCM10010872_33470 [Dyella flava]|nr:hypothetical protein GCM10010872_33470 [Dyella flava]
MARYLMAGAPSFVGATVFRGIKPSNVTERKEMSDDHRTFKPADVFPAWF